MSRLRSLLAGLLPALVLSNCSTVKECVVNNPHRGQPLALNAAIEEITVANAVHGGTVQIGTELRVPGASGLLDVGARVRVRSTREPDLYFGPEFPMAATTPDRYARSLYRLNFGPYEACVEADFAAISPPGSPPGQPGSPPPDSPAPQPTRTLTDHLLFFVEAAEPCYTWADPGAGTAGWTWDGIVDVATGNTIDSGTPPVFNRMELDVPLDVPGLTVLTGPLPGASPTGLWYFDYISPDLTELADWQNLEEIAFRVYTNGFSVQAQPIFTYVYDDDTEHLFAPVDEEGDRIFYSIEGTTTVYSPTLRPGDVPLSRVRIRIFGEYVTTTPEFIVHLEVVCPLPSRQPSVLRAVLGEWRAQQSKDVP